MLGSANPPFAFQIAIAKFKTRILNGQRIAMARTLSCCFCLQSKGSSGMNEMKLNSRVFALSALWLLCLTAALGQIAVSSTFDIAVESDAAQLVSGNAMLTYSDSQGATLNPYSHSLSVTHTNDLGGFVTTTSSAAAAWTNAGAGTVTFRDMGWVLASTLNHEAKLNNFFHAVDVWSYTFTAGADGFFSMNYDVRGVGATFGLLGVVLHWSGMGGDLNLEDPYNPGAHGTFVRSISSGGTYTVGIKNSGNIFRAAGIPGTTSGHMDADFDWNITPVPEPASFAMLAIGSLALLRRRR